MREGVYECISLILKSLHACMGMCMCVCVCVCVCARVHACVRMCVRTYVHMWGTSDASYLTDTLILLQNVVSENGGVELNYGGKDVHTCAHNVRVLISLRRRDSSKD